MPIVRQQIDGTIRDTEPLPSLDAETAALRMEALQALTSLGYNQQTAEKSLRLVLKETPGSKLTLEELIKRALRHTANRS